MLEMLRTFCGYCHSCRRACVVGEFCITGWQHKFNLCEACVDRLKAQLASASVGVAETIYAESLARRP